MKEYTYILRYAIQPGHHEEEKLDALSRFCRDARIDDVMFFINCEEINQGHLTIEETKPWMEMIARAKKQLNQIRVTTSINPWITMLHADRGRKLKPGQNYSMMVDPYGNRASAQVCPLSQEWREYVKKMYAYYACAEPNMIWVEDDFRFHNHGPLVWGGCFCDDHMKLFSELAGVEVTREEFVNGLLKTGTPHPFRKIWLDSCRRTLVELAEEIGKSVHEVSPSTRVGLMSSIPVIHCAEGRDWEGILKGLAGSTPLVNRPHLPAYSDKAPQSYLWEFTTVSRPSRAFVPKETEIYPELENFPFTLYSKSEAFMRYQLETSLVLNPQGITLNIFDMMGNGVMNGERYAKVLSGSKDFLSAVKALGLNGGIQKGIRVMVSPNSSYTLNTQEGKSMTELYPEENFWAAMFSALGIANTYELDISVNGEIIAVSGQYFKNLDKKDILKLFENNFVFLEGEAVYTLLDMGLGDIIGVKSAVWHEQDDGYHSYEQVCGNDAYCGMTEVRLSNQASAGDLINIEYSGSSKNITIVKNAEGKTVAAGMSLVGNKIFILPFGRFKGRVQALLNPARQEIIQGVLSAINNGNIVFTKGVPYLTPYCYEVQDRKRLIISNNSPDEVEGILIHMLFTGTDTISVLDRNGKNRKVKGIERNGNYIKLNETIKGYETIALIWE